MFGGFLLTKTVSYLVHGVSLRVDYKSQNESLRLLHIYRDKSGKSCHWDPSLSLPFFSSSTRRVTCPVWTCPLALAAKEGPWANEGAVLISWMILLPLGAKIESRSECLSLGRNSTEKERERGPRENRELLVNFEPTPYVAVSEQWARVIPPRVWSRRRWTCCVPGLPGPAASFAEESWTRRQRPLQVETTELESW